MKVPTPGRSCVDELESIKIQLTLERAQPALAEVERNNLLEELVRLVDGKGSAVCNKANNIRSAGSFDLNKKTM